MAHIERVLLWLKAIWKTQIFVLDTRICYFIHMFSWLMFVAATSIAVVRTQDSMLLIQFIRSKR